MNNDIRLFIPLCDNGSGEMKANYFMSLVSAFNGIHVSMERFSDSLPSRARNRAAAAFLRSDQNRMLFIDGDILFNKQHIEWLLESPHPITAGIYCKKEKGVAPCLNTLPDMPNTPVGGYIEIARAGTGFLMIDREVLEKMKSDSIEYTNHGQPEWDFFPVGVKNKEYLSEDWFFCDHARVLGYKIMLDSRIQVRHEGTAIFPLEETIAATNGTIATPALTVAN